MRPIERDDLLTIDEFTARRNDFFEAHRRYCDTYRRVRVGEAAVCLFENRQTLWFRLQEILRIAQITEAAWVRQEMSLVNLLLPRRNTLCASLMLSEPISAFEPNSIRIVVGPATIRGTVSSARPGTEIVQQALWIDFAMSPIDRVHFNDSRNEAWIELNVNDELAASDALDAEVRQSLLDDLESSDRSAA
jgi:hypothetical protein